MDIHLACIQLAALSSQRNSFAHYPQTDVNNVLEAITEVIKRFLSKVFFEMF